MRVPMRRCPKWFGTSRLGLAVDECDLAPFGDDSGWIWEIMDIVVVLFEKKEVYDEASADAFQDLLAYFNKHASDPTKSVRHNVEAALADFYDALKDFE
jgi:hypothetical protein